MSILDHAIAHIRSGRPVFPGVPDEKLPAIRDPYSHYTLDEKQVLSWWKENPRYNILLPMGVEVEPGKFLGAIDFDVKDDRNGFQTREKLAAIGLEFPETFTQFTPNNGIHLIYLFNQPIGNGVNSLGLGIDHRGFHGYVVGGGSFYHGKEYLYKNGVQITQAEKWFTDRCQRRRDDGRRNEESRERRLSVVHDVQETTATQKGVRYLQALVPAKQGERNRKGFEAACRLKDFGFLRDDALELLVTHWKCEPVLGYEELASVVDSAFKYGQNEIGVDSPVNAFDPLPPEEPPKKPRHPVDVLNDRYAIVVQNGVRILREGKGPKGEYKIDHLSVHAFHDIEANNLMTVGEKSVPVSKMWLRSTERRQYDGIIFAPNYDNPKYYNVWRGFAVGAPKGESSPEAKKSLELFLEHLRENICQGELELYKWLVAYFAHLIQTPEKKPRVAVVFQGQKGVGKNVVTDCLSYLLGSHYFLAADRQRVFGRFNSQLENNLLFVLDEAFWSGDKAMEGILKDLVTGSTRTVERKGHDIYTVANLSRIFIFGNEEWLVPASDDERRYAVFNVASTRINDGDFFGAIKDGMRDHGGAELLYQFLKDFDMTGVDISRAPNTKGLTAQKEHTLPPFEAWWLASLHAGYILGHRSAEWPTEISRNDFRDAFYKEVKGQNIGSRLPNATKIGMTFTKMAPSSSNDKMLRDGELRYRVYEVATLEAARLEFETFIGGKIDWNN